METLMMWDSPLDAVNTIGTTLYTVEGNFIHLDTVEISTKLSQNTSEQIYHAIQLQLLRVSKESKSLDDKDNHTTKLIVALIVTQGTNKFQ